MTHVKQALAVDGESFRSITRVSRETVERLESYVALLESWQRRVNLIGESTRSEVWQRHILDSAQIFPLLPKSGRRLLDIGSGAGLPGLVLAILGVPEVHLVESNGRKAAFLREASRISGAKTVVHNQRIESLPAFPADVITARAVAKVNELLDYAAPFIHDTTVCVFMKSKGAHEEVRLARRAWEMRATFTPSISDRRGIIVRLEDLHHA